MKKLVVKKGKWFFPSKEMKKVAWLTDEKVYNIAERDPIAFWEKLAKEGIDWFKTWEKVYEEKLPFFRWFVGAKVNASYNCLDRHKKKNKNAIIWIPEPEKEKPRKITYQELYEKTCKLANFLLKIGIKKGDVVAIYLPMIPEVIVSMLACARIGAIHTVVFSAFSSEALKKRLLDSGAKVLITADAYYRRGKLIELKKQAEEAVRGTKVKKIIIVRRAEEKISFKYKELDFNAIEKMPAECKPRKLDSEHPLFILYTSGTTGTPKGIIHDTGGYLVQAYWTAKWDFDLHENDIMWCTADIGWITGHTYACYGPLLNGITTLIYEGSFDFPNPSRTWKIIDRYKVNIFYTAPTLVRMFISFGEKWLKNFKGKSLKILGTVGEPIDEKTWLWFFEKIGKKRLPIIDTWWQTETGGTLINSLPGIGPFIPGVAGRSFPGTRHAIINEKGKILKRGEGYLVQLSPFAPGMLRGVWKNPKLYQELYWSRGNFYFTGDAALLQEKKFKLLGRIDDVLKVAGHRISNAEIEDALTKHPFVVEAAVTSKPDAIKGEVPIAFVVLKKGVKVEEKLKEELIIEVEKRISKIARPSEIYFVEELPKTRSGKIMRRILRALLRKEPTGDITTLVNPESVEKIKKILNF